MFLWFDDPYDWDQYLRRPENRSRNRPIHSHAEARLQYLTDRDCPLPPRRTPPPRSRCFAVHLLDPTDPIPQYWDLVLRTEWVHGETGFDDLYVPILCLFQDRPLSPKARQVICQIFFTYPDRAVIVKTCRRGETPSTASIVRAVLVGLVDRLGMTRNDRVMIVSTVSNRCQRIQTDALDTLSRWVFLHPQSNGAIRSAPDSDRFFIYIGSWGSSMTILGVDPMASVRSTVLTMVIEERPSDLIRRLLTHRERGVDRTVVYLGSCETHQRHYHPRALFHSLTPWVKEGWLTLYVSDLPKPSPDQNNVILDRWCQDGHASTTDWVTVEIPDSADSSIPMVWIRPMDAGRTSIEHPSDESCPSGSPPHDPRTLTEATLPRAVRVALPLVLIFYHVGAIGPLGLPTLKEQLQYLRVTGLYDRAAEIAMGVVGSELDIRKIDGDRIRVLYQDPDPTVYEIRTINALRQRVIDLPYEDAFILYFHTKGVSSSFHHNPKAVLSWRRFMEYQLLGRFERCLSLMLDHGLDVLGGNFVNQNPSLDPAFFRVHPDHACHYSGNFWWARASYIRRLPILVPHTAATHPDTHPHYRIQAENWILSAIRDDGVRAGEAFRYRLLHPYARAVDMFECPADYFRLLPAP